MMKKFSLGLMMFLMFGMFSGVNVSKVQAADLACTIEYPDGRIEEGTWINGTCQPNGSVSFATDYKVNVKPVSFFEKIKLAFTFNAEKKAELLANFSNRNFELAKQEFEAGNTAEANIFLQKSEDNAEKAEDSASRIKDEERKEEALSSLSVTASNRTTVLTEVKAKIESATAKEAIQNAIDAKVEVKSSTDIKGEVKESEEKDSTGVSASGSVSGSATGSSASGGASLGGATVTIPPVLSGTAEVGATVCNSNSTPSVTVISPNGGETYTAGQQISVKWESCNIDTNVVIELLMYPPNGASVLNESTIDDGAESVTLPTISNFDHMVYGNHFKILLHPINAGIAENLYDLSNNSFAIN